MFALGAALISAGLILALVYGIVSYYCYKAKEEFVRKAEAMKPGDLYKYEFRYCDNPFIEKSIRYAKIIEVRLDEYGNPWVKYDEGEDIPQIKYMKVKTFLRDYELVE